MGTRSLFGTAPFVVTAAAVLCTAPAGAGQVQVTINGSPSSVCCGTVLAADFYENSYAHSFMYAPLQFAHEGATVSADLATGLLKGSSYASGQTGVFWLAGMQEDFRIKRENPGPGEFVDVTLSVRVEADPEWNTGGEFFESIVSTAKLDFGRATAFGLSEVTSAQWKHIWSFSGIGLGATESYTGTPTGNVVVTEATKQYFDVTLHTSKSVFIADNAVESSLFGFNFFLNADIYTDRGGGVSFDAAHTARVMIDLPQGFTLASASGVFLSTPVPVPAPFCLLGAALPVLLAKRRRSGAR